jgi:hypothetical protein
MEDRVAAFFLIVLVVGSGTYFGLKVARAHRGEPWVATEAFKNNMALFGPNGVSASTSKPSSARPWLGDMSAGRKTVRVRTRPRPSRRSSSSEGLQFALALLLAGCAFTSVCAALGMLAWEFALGTWAATGLFAAILLEPKDVSVRVAERVIYLGQDVDSDGFEFIDDYAYEDGYGAEAYG